MEQKIEHASRKVYYLNQAEFKEELGIRDPEDVLMVEASWAGVKIYMMSSPTVTIEKLRESRGE